MDLDLVLGVEFVCLMGDGGSGKKITSTKEMENLSFGISSKRFSRDLLQRFMGSGSSNEVEGLKEEDEDEGIELNLGLSLGGRFGVDKSSKGLVRSSSIASCLPVVRDDNDMVATIPSSIEYTGLVRTSSLPVETEEEWRKRKELQSLRRLEAKRRRSEKQRVVKGGDKESGGSGISRGGSLSLEERKDIEVNLRERLEREKCLAAVKKLSSSVGLSPWAAAAASQVILRSGSDVAIALAKGKGSSSGGIRDFGLPVPQASVESKGGSSSSVSDLESKTQQGSTGELSPGSIQSMQNGTNQDGGSRAIGESTSSRAEASSSKKADTSRTRGRETATGTNSLQDMPSVFTKGDGPNGRRVDGILYKYGKGEEVRIMCVCHGSFHSPAEFVQHAGGTDVDNPLKHIVINPSSSCLL